MHTHTHDHPNLTKNQTFVMDALDKASGPLSAYTILDQLRESGFRAPLQVYRALDKLVEFGMVHRLESLNAFVACQQSHCADSETVAFKICEKCDLVEEISDAALTKRLNVIAREGNFDLKKSTIELRGVCKGCVDG